MGMVSPVKTLMMGMTMRQMKMAMYWMRQNMHHSQHSDPTTQFLQDGIDFWTHTEIVNQD